MKRRPKVWEVTGVYGEPTRMRLAHGHRPQLPHPEKAIWVIQVPSWLARLLITLGATR